MYSIKKVSEITGIPPVTIRAWENRYQVISPNRSEGGHRLYSQKDIDVLIWLNNQVQNHGMKISEAVRLLNLSAIHSDASDKFSTNSIHEWMENLYTSLTNLDNDEAHRIVDFAFSTNNYEDVFHKLLVPLLHRIGDEWKKGNLTVAQEHFSSQFIIQRCTQIFRYLPTDPHLPKVLAFCPEGEEHHIGLMIFSLFLRKKGMDVIYLGPNTPFEGLLSLIKMKDIRLITISITNPNLTSQVNDWIGQALGEYPYLKFVIGGMGAIDSQIIENDSITLLFKQEWEYWYKSVIRGL